MTFNQGGNKRHHANYQQYNGSQINIPLKPWNG